jgi:hypothetical protein
MPQFYQDVQTECTAHATRTGRSHQLSSKGPTRCRRSVGLKQYRTRFAHGQKKQDER